MASIEEQRYAAEAAAMAARLQAPGVQVAVMKVTWGTSEEGRTRLELVFKDRQHDGASHVAITGNDLAAVEAKARSVIATLAEGAGDAVIVYRLGRTITSAKFYYGH